MQEKIRAHIGYPTVVLILAQAQRQEWQRLQHPAAAALMLAAAAWAAE